MGHQDNDAIGPDGKKAGMAHGNLTGVTHQNIQTHHNGYIYGHVINDIHIIIFCDERKEGEDQNQNSQPENDCAGCENLNIFVIVSFHIHGQILQKQRQRKNDFGLFYILFHLLNLSSIVCLV